MLLAILEPLQQEQDLLPLPQGSAQAPVFVPHRVPNPVPEAEVVSLPRRPRWPEALRLPEPPRYPPPIALQIQQQPKREEPTKRPGSAQGGCTDQVH